MHADVGVLEGNFKRCTLINGGVAGGNVTLFPDKKHMW